ncbi:hypothetical protein G6F32_015335 [Rhizopus arrhizus]|nr:hypothetical protein G6F32_015335 [Rhizopus arrhizus]
MPHRFITDPQLGADMACANLHFEGGRLNPISAALPDFICLPLADLYGGHAALELLFEEAFEQRCGRAAMVNRLWRDARWPVRRARPPTSAVGAGGDARSAGTGVDAGRPGRCGGHVAQRIRGQFP